MRDIDKSKKARNDPDVEKEALEWSDKLREMYGITQKIVQKVYSNNMLSDNYFFEISINSVNDKSFKRYCCVKADFINIFLLFTI